MSLDVTWGETAKRRKIAIKEAKLMLHELAAKLEEVDSAALSIDPEQSLAPAMVLHGTGRNTWVPNVEVWAGMKMTVACHVFRNTRSRGG